MTMTEKFIWFEIETYAAQMYQEKINETREKLNQIEATLKELYKKRSKIERRLARQQRKLRRVQKNSIRPEELDEAELLAENMTA